MFSIGELLSIGEMQRMELISELQWMEAIKHRALERKLCSWMEPKMLSIAELNRRGWTEPMVWELLGDPDKIVPMPCGWATFHCGPRYALSRIEAAEATGAFAAMRMRVVRMRQAERKQAEKNRARLATQAFWEAVEATEAPSAFAAMRQAARKRWGSIRACLTAKRKNA